MGSAVGVIPGVRRKGPPKPPRANPSQALWKELFSTSKTFCQGRQRRQRAARPVMYPMCGVRATHACRGEQQRFPFFWWICIPWKTSVNETAFCGIPQPPTADRCVDMLCDPLTEAHIPTVLLNFLCRHNPIGLCPWLNFDLRLNLHQLLLRRGGISISWHTKQTHTHTTKRTHARARTSHGGV